MCFKIGTFNLIFKIADSIIIIIFFFFFFFFFFKSGLTVHENYHNYNNFVTNIKAFIFQEKNKKKKKI